MNKIYLENGTTVKTDFTGGIALSSYPTEGIDFPYALTIEGYGVVAGDFAGETLNITPIGFINKYYVVKDNTDAIQATQYFTNFSMKMYGQYRFHYEKTAGVVTIYMWQGKAGRGEMCYNSTTGKNDYTVNYTLNTGIANGTVFDGYIDYKTGVICKGDEVTVVVGASEKVRCLSAVTNNLYSAAGTDAFPGNFIRFYVKEYGSFKLLDDTNATTQELTLASLCCDELYIKETLKLSAINQIDMSVELIDKEQFTIKIRAGEVANKATWTKDATGLQTMFNDINGWI